MTFAYDITFRINNNVNESSGSYFTIQSSERMQMFWSRECSGWFACIFHIYCCANSKTMVGAYIEFEEVLNGKIHVGGTVMSFPRSQLAPGDMVMTYAGANTGDAAIIERHFPEAADPA